MSKLCDIVHANNPVTFHTDLYTLCMFDHTCIYDMMCVQTMVHTTKRYNCLAKKVQHTLCKVCAPIKPASGVPGSPAHKILNGLLQVHAEAMDDTWKVNAYDYWFITNACVLSTSKCHRD